VGQEALGNEVASIFLQQQSTCNNIGNVGSGFFYAVLAKVINNHQQQLSQSRVTISAAVT
jgi:3-hydroxy-3-methylglutaryl CoA synthase